MTGVLPVPAVTTWTQVSTAASDDGRRLPPVHLDVDHRRQIPRAELAHCRDHQVRLRAGRPAGAEELVGAAENARPTSCWPSSP